jgi:hypothetical protein
VQALACCSTPATAGKLFEWRDEKGQLHISDTRPAGQQATEREITVTAPYHKKNSHLRPGELETLKKMAQRASRQYQQSQNERQRNDRLVTRKRKDCSNTRDKLQATRNRAMRKRYIHQLRKNCW